MITTINNVAKSIHSTQMNYFSLHFDNESMLRMQNIYVIIIIVFLHGLGRLTCSDIDALPSFPGASTISSSSRLAVQGVFRKSGVVHSFKMVDPVLFVFGSHVLYSRDLQLFSYDLAFLSSIFYFGTHTQCVPKQKISMYGENFRHGYSTNISVLF